MQFFSHRLFENKQVAKKAIAVVVKRKTVIDYWKELQKSKQPGSGKPGVNCSYDHLCAD